MSIIFKCFSTFVVIDQNIGTGTIFARSDDARFQNYSTEKRMLRLYADFVLHRKKQSMSQANPVDVGTVSFDEIIDLKNMV